MIDAWFLSRIAIRDTRSTQAGRYRGSSQSVSTNACDSMSASATTYSPSSSVSSVSSGRLG
jgi:hypothetical protein